ncbi:hypothetical protein [Fusobacterium sp. PH5-44]|uniref:hypothetical protein n=1 Tax=unclassified Fusobacterium TaxID=2648384 RepID=UPI003D2055DE
MEDFPDIKLKNDKSLSSMLKEKEYIMDKVDGEEIYFYKDNYFTTTINGESYIAIAGSIAPEITSMYVENLSNAYYNHDKAISYWTEKELKKMYSFEIEKYFKFYKTIEEMEQEFKK